MMEHQQCIPPRAHAAAVSAPRPEDVYKATLNLLEDSTGERRRHERAERALGNLLEDLDTERVRLQDANRAALNIVDDLAAERRLLAQKQEEVARSARALRVALAEKELLLKELHHRVKNNLQTICSLLSLQAASLRDPVASEALKASTERVRSMALVHEGLYQSSDLSRIDFARYVVDLLEQIFRSHSGAARGIVRKVELCPAQLSIDRAISCGLILNELIANSFKHAFPGRSAGVIHVVLRRLDPAHLELSMADDGVGSPGDAEATRTGSLGLELVSAFAEQLGARVDVDRGRGTAYRFTFAAEQVTS